MNRVILYAPNIHVGGGLVLLKGLIKVWPKDICLNAYFDERASNNLDIPNKSHVTWIKPKIFSRIRAEISLSDAVSEGDIVVFLNSLPPLFKCRGEVIVFMQNRIFVENISLRKYKLNQAARIMIERGIAYFLRHRVDEYIVQTNSFKRDLEDWYTTYPNLHKPIVNVLPFTEVFRAKGNGSLEVRKQTWDFIYVGDGLAHKNHINLFDAWAELARQDIFPSLALTLDSSQTELLSIIKELKSTGLKITNLGILPHEILVRKYQECGALIYPSLRESFGLPLVEASILGLPILASELDYVYDVCKPVATFDPNSFRSITRTVKHFLGFEESIPVINPPTRFLEYVFSRTEEVMPDEHR